VIDLGTVAGHIFHFESYWGKEPRSLGEDHIRHYLAGDSASFRGMLYEFATAYHFTNAGLDKVIPIFSRPDSADKADILLQRKYNIIEVHCKSKIAGAGSGIHWEDFEYLSGCVLAVLERATSDNRRIVLKCQSNLASSELPGILDKLRQLIHTGLLLEAPIIANRYTVKIESITMPPQGLNESEVSSVADQKVHRGYLVGNPTLTSRGLTYKRVLIFDAVDSGGDSLDSLRSSIHAAITQASGDRPSIITIHHYQPMHWELAVRSQKFRAFVASELTSENGSKVGGIAFTAEPPTANRLIEGMYQKSLPALLYRNSAAKKRCSLPADFDWASHKSKPI
jgi:hypothetical protein